MERAGRIVRIANGVYSLPMEGIRNCVPANKAIVDMLAAGPRTNAALIVGTRLTEGAIHAAIHRLGKQGKIIRVKRGKYGLPGTAVPHVYAKDAINQALQSGSKTGPELVAATGKNRGEIWQALHRLKAKGLIRSVRRGYQAAFALPPERKALRRAA
jgi:biotin operon repressor